MNNKVRKHKKLSRRLKLLSRRPWTNESAKKSLKTPLFQASTGPATVETSDTNGDPQQ
jgi:hypothetical protein